MFCRSERHNFTFVIPRSASDTFVIPRSASDTFVIPRSVSDTFVIPRSVSDEESLRKRFLAAARNDRRPAVRDRA